MPSGQNQYVPMHEYEFPQMLKEAGMWNGDWDDVSDYEEPDYGWDWGWSW